MFSIFSHKRNANQNLTQSEWPSSRKQTTNASTRRMGCGEGALTYCWGECKLVRPYGNQYRFFKKLKISWTTKWLKQA
jgi:hypothetical protein